MSTHYAPMFLLLFAIVIAAFIAFLIKVLEAYQPENLSKRPRRRVGATPRRRLQRQWNVQVYRLEELHKMWQRFVWGQGIRPKRRAQVNPETVTLLYAMCGGDRSLAQRLVCNAPGESVQKQWEQAIAQLTRDRR